MPQKDPLHRLYQRPNVDQWRGDEPITLREAVALFFPEGPLTISSFRAAIRRGELAFMKLAGKMFTTPDAIRVMLHPQVRTPTGAHQPERAIEPGRLTEAQMRASQERAFAIIEKLRNGPQPPKKPISKRGERGSAG